MRYSLLSGDEPVTLNGKPVGFSVLDFWSFQYSNLWNMQDQIAEFIVAKALGQDMPYNKNGWTLWDLNYRGKRIEVKETGYYYSWQSDGKISQARSFGISKAYSQYKDNKSTFKRQSDVYVFCLNIGYTKEESNPIELTHWRFWVVPTVTINCLCGDNKKISLGRLKSITQQPDGITYGELKSTVDEALESMK